MYNDVTLESQIIWKAPCENVFSGICEQRKPIPACPSAQSVQDLQCSLIESLNTMERTKYGKVPDQTLYLTLADLDLYCLHLPRKYHFTCRGSYVNNKSDTLYWPRRVTRFFVYV